MGGAAGTAEFARLFLIPGVDHDFTGAGPSPTRLMDTIVAWVEEGKAPGSSGADWNEAMLSFLVSPLYDTF